jgi:hypothetical protein
LAPDDGETVADVFYRTGPHPQAPKLAPDDHGLIYLPDAAFGDAPNAAAEELAVLAAVQRPISLICISVAVPRPLWKVRPAWFLVAEQDRMIILDNQRFMAERMQARVSSHAVDHMPIVTAPAVVLDVLRDAFAAVRIETIAGDVGRLSAPARRCAPSLRGPARALALDWKPHIRRSDVGLQSPHASPFPRLILARERAMVA